MGEHGSHVKSRVGPRCGAALHFRRNAAIAGPRKIEDFVGEKGTAASTVLSGLALKYSWDSTVPQASRSTAAHTASRARGTAVKRTERLVIERPLLFWYNQGDGDPPVSSLTGGERKSSQGRKKLFPGTFFSKKPSKSQEISRKTIGGTT